MNKRCGQVYNQLILTREINLQFLQFSEPWEDFSSELSYCIVLEIPKIENMFIKQKPLLNQ